MRPSPGITNPADSAFYVDEITFEIMALLMTKNYDEN